MSVVPVFTGRVLPGGLLVIDRQKDYARHVRSFHGRFVEVVVRKLRTKRSLDQNAYLHAVPFPMLADALGYDSIDELKYDLMGECWGWTRTKLGHDIPMMPHTSAMSTEQCTQFIEWLVRFGAQLPSAVLIPLPNEAEAA